MQVGGRHWAVALSGAMLVHAGVAAAVLWQPPQSGAVSAGMGGVEFSLGPAGGAPGDRAQPIAEVEEAEVVEAHETARAESPPEKAALAPPETAPPEHIQPVEIENDKPRETPVEDVVAPPMPKLRPEPPEPPRPEVVEELIPEPALQTVGPAEEQLARVAPSTAGASGKAGTQARPESGSADTSSGGGIPGETADYMALLQAWIEKHKEYPRRAQARRQEGTALLYFVMDRDGRLIEYRLQKSSGHGLLDQEVTAMIERAQPLPKMPEDMSRARLELVVPVQFFLR